MALLCILIYYMFSALCSNGLHVNTLSTFYDITATKIGQFVVQCTHLMHNCLISIA